MKTQHLPPKRWRHQIERTPVGRKWRAAFRRLGELGLGDMDEAAGLARRFIGFFSTIQIPSRYRFEIREAADASGLDYDHLLAAQTVYDLATTGAIAAYCGCTSVVKGKTHGRNLDWDFPNLTGLMSWLPVRHFGRLAYHAEHVPGVIGWTGARFADKAKTVANLNQAPSTYFRRGLPALLAFRRLCDNGHIQRIADGDWEDSWWEGCTDAILHVSKLVGGTRYPTVVEIYRGRGTMREDDIADVAANHYEVVEESDYDGEPESFRRAKQARKARGVKAALESCEMDIQAWRWTA